MPTTLVVDGYNAINAIPEAQKELDKNLYSARKIITAIAKEYARSSGYITDVKVVFDGQDRYRERDRLYPPGRKDQVFSATGGGDDKIIETVRKCSRYGRVVLASNDNYVRNNARAYGASPIASGELVSAKNKKKKIKEKTEKADRGLLKEITREYREELGL